MSVTAVVLAAGKGTRMKSELPKPLHRIRGRSLLAWVVGALDGFPLSSTVMVVGHGRELVVDALAREFPGREFLFAEQRSQRGTGDAAAVGLAELDLHDGGFSDDEHVIVLPGDAPLVRPETVKALVDAHREHDAACTLVTAVLDDPSGYGRILRRDGEGVQAIVEDRDADPDQLAIREINGGMYCFRRSLLSPALRMIDADNSQGELYLTDVIGVLVEAGHRVAPFEVDPIEISGVNDRAQLGFASQVIAARILHGHMRRGVTLVAPGATVIDATVTIAPDVTVHAGTVLEGDTSIGTGASIGPNTHLVNADVGDGATVQSSVVRNATVPPGASIGPFVSLGESDASASS